MQLYSGALAIGVHTFQVVAPIGASWFRFAATREAWPDEANVAVMATRDFDGSVVGGWTTRGGAAINPHTGLPSPESWGKVPAPGGLPLPIEVPVTITVTITGAAINTTLFFDHGA